MEVVYSDLNQSNLGVDPLLYNIEDIEQSIDNILITTPSERFFLPEFGCMLRSMLFELGTESNTFNIYEKVRSAILKWEKRVIIKDAKSYVRFDKQNNRLYIKFELDVPSLNIKDYSYTRSVNISRFR